MLVIVSTTHGLTAHVSGLFVDLASMCNANYMNDQMAVFN